MATSTAIDKLTRAARLFRSFAAATVVRSIVRYERERVGGDETGEPSPTTELASSLRCLKSGHRAAYRARDNNGQPVPLISAMKSDGHHGPAPFGNPFCSKSKPHGKQRGINLGTTCVLRQLSPVHTRTGAA